MKIFLKDDAGIDWQLEPDIDAYRRLFEISKLDPASSISGLEDLASQGSVASMIRLAAICMVSNLPRDRSRAKYWYSQSSDMGNAYSTFMSARMSFDDSEFERAKMLFEELLKKNDARAYYWLGKMYDGGLGVPQNSSAAKALFEKSSQLGNPFASRDLASLLMFRNRKIGQLPRALLLICRSLYQALTTGHRWL